jgi:hypothetical protein
VKTRLLVLVNIALIPYVIVRFPGEARDYIYRCFRYLVSGDTDFSGWRKSGPDSATTTEGGTE